MRKSSINSRDQVSNNHAAYLKYCTDTERYSTVRVRRAQALTASDIKQPTYQYDKFISSRAYMTPEAMAFLFLLEGYHKKLLLYLVFFEVEDTTCKFRWNKGTIWRFKKYLGLFNEPGNDGTINQALNALKEANCVQNVSRGEYMLNPLILRSSKPATRRNLINDYSILLLRKNKDAIVNFYPDYGTPST